MVVVVVSSEVVVVGAGVGVEAEVEEEEEGVFGLWGHGGRIWERPAPGPQRENFWRRCHS